MSDQSKDVDPTTEASLANAAHNAGLSSEPGVPMTSGDVEVGHTPDGREIEGGQVVTQTVEGQEERINALTGDESGSSTGGGGDADDGRPPLGGEGSGRDEWAAYAENQGVTVDDDMSRDDIVKAVDKNR